jgi:hypothetical protein
VIYEVDDCKELRDFLKEEYGKYGTKIADENFIKDRLRAKAEDLLETLEDNEIEYDPNKTYLSAEFISWSSEGDEKGNDAFLAKIIPNKYIKKIYDEEEH